MFDTLLLSVATVFGVVLAPVLPYVGVPIAAAGVAGLVYQDRLSTAVSGAVFGIVVAIALRPVDAVFVVPAVLAVFFAVLMLPRMNTQAVAAVLIGALTAATVGVDALAARLAGNTLPVQIATQAQALVDEVGKSMGSSVSPELLSQLSSTAKLLGSTWPATYFSLAVFVGVVVIVVVGRSAKKLERPIEIPSLKQLDLTPHVLWAFVSGLLLLAASYSSISMAAGIGVIGTNLLLCARAFLLIQGLSVMAAVLEKVGILPVGRVFGLVGFAVLDALTLAVSFTGLVDFWVNFRRLPRDGFTPSAPEHEMSDR